MSPEQKSKTDRVKAAVALLAEHFDSVQVVVTWRHERGSSDEFFDCGAGSIYARQSSMEQWCRQMREFERIEARKRAIDNAHGGDEEESRFS